MEVTSNTTIEEGQVWGGGNQPLNASYGKMMMWFFYSVRCLDLYRLSRFLWVFEIQKHKLMAYCR